MTIQKICGLFGSLILEIWHLNHVLDVNKCREWVVDRSQNMGPNCLEFLVIFSHLRDCPESWVLFVWRFGIKMLAWYVGPGMAVDYGFTK